MKQAIRICPAAVERPQQSHGIPLRLEQMLDQMGGGGFAIGARHPYQSQS